MSLKKKIFLVGIPFINAGVVFNEGDLELRVQSLLDEVKILLPELKGYKHIDLGHEILVGEKQLILNIFLHESVQSTLAFIDNQSLHEIKELVVEALKLLPIKLNLLNLNHQSINSIGRANDVEANDKDLKKLMKKRQKKILKFLLEGEEMDLSFPEMAPYYVDSEVMTIEFKIEYIHARHLKIKLLSDWFEKGKRKRALHLLVGKKFREDKFYEMCTEALRPNKVLTCSVISYIDNFTHQILVLEAVTS